MNGIVVGGWEFVWAAYVLTGLSFLVYGVTVITGLRAAHRRSASGGGSR